MVIFFLTLALIVIPVGAQDDRFSQDLTELYNSHNNSMSDQDIPLEYDCALRAFTIEMAAYIAPAPLKANWTTLSQNAFQMSQCNTSVSASYQKSSSAKPFSTAPEPIRRACHHTVFVHSSKGNDLFDGTFRKPMRTIHGALSLTRTLRTIYHRDKVLCITIRGGTYYLGTNATTSSSQIGALSLTTNDSNIVIENYQNERVVLSGGILLDLQWSVYTKTLNGGTIMKAQVPSNVNLDQFNELYIDGSRAIVAKYPNGDPSTKGLYVNDTGFSNDSQNWIRSLSSPGATIQVQTPNRSGTAFPNYHLIVGGSTSVFNPPRSFWPGYGIPRGFIVKDGALPRLNNWSNPRTGYVHAFHGGFWGSWVFQIASSNSTDNTILFSRGGFQEARGWPYGGPFYVSNIFEELDSPNEWFLDKDTRTLYFMPNDTMPNVFVASQIPCLISVSGSNIVNVAKNILIQGLILTETSNTYMRDYMVPSGGDWAVHRGGSIYLTNTKNITITHNVLTQLGSNGVALIDYNDATSITSNEFVWLADSAIILVGSTNGIDGFSTASQPTNTLIQSNLIHEIGIYIKQASPILISVSRSVSVIGNLMFNMPRAAININDGFYGNHTISWNVIFNAVRETKDHGPINTWDRQPFLTDAVHSGLPSLWQHDSYIHHNTIFGNYHTLWPIDHDDGSCFYEDSYNFLVYGGKKNYLGHSKTDHHEIYVYPDLYKPGFGSGNCVCGSSGWYENWIENVCVLYQISIPYSIGNCDVASLLLPYFANNTIYIPSGKEATFICNVNDTSTRMTLQEWQSYGLDINTTIGVTPNVQTIVEWGRKMLQETI